MNLDKAYLNWSLEPENTPLAAKMKNLVHKVWWLIPTNKPCSYYTFDVLGRALSQVQYDRKDKAQAASVMFHVLTWAHKQEPDINPQPSFSFQDWNRERQNLRRSLQRHRLLHPRPCLRLHRPQRI